jgi:hypothetical protein
MAPTIGRIVIIHYADGRTEPAVVTAVHGDRMINARVFADTAGPLPWETSVPQRGIVGVAGGYGGPLWDWPQRT